MSEEMNQLPAELREVERALGALAPARVGLDRDRLMFEAGRGTALRAGKMRVRLWQGMCGVLVLACAALAAFPRDKAGPTNTVAHPVRQPAVPAAPDTSPTGPRMANVALPNAPGDDDALPLAMLGLRRGMLAGEWRAWQTNGGSGGGGGAHMPALKPGDGLEALPAWQKRAALLGGKS